MTEGIEIFSQTLNKGDSPRLFIALIRDGVETIHSQEIGWATVDDEDETIARYLVTEPANLLVFLEKVGLNKLIDIQKKFASDLSMSLLRETLEKIKRT